MFYLSLDFLSLPRYQMRYLIKSDTSRTFHSGIFVNDKVFALDNPEVSDKTDTSTALELRSELAVASGR